MSAGITRIVMMTFKSNEVETFINIFKESQALIQAFPGCNKVQLHKNIDDPCIMYTVSLWDNDECLQNYRKSDLFNKTWAKTKILFDAKPQAWSLTELRP